MKERNVNKTFKCIEIYDTQSMVKKQTYSLQLKTHRYLKKCSYDLKDIVCQK